MLLYVGYVLFSREDLGNDKLIAPFFRVVGHDGDDQLVCLESYSIDSVISESDKRLQDWVAEEGMMNENFF